MTTNRKPLSAVEHYNRQKERLTKVQSLFHQDRTINYYGEKVHFHSCQVTDHPNFTRHTFNLSNEAAIVIDIPYIPNNCISNEVPKSTQTTKPTTEPIQPSHGCFNRQPKVNKLIVQDGYHHSDKPSIRTARFIEVPSAFYNQYDENDVSEPECKYTYSSPPDPRCNGCCHQNPSHHETISLKLKGLK